MRRQVFLRCSDRVGILLFCRRASRTWHRMCAHLRYTVVWLSHDMATGMGKEARRTWMGTCGAASDASETWDTYTFFVLPSELASASTIRDNRDRDAPPCRTTSQEQCSNTRARANALFAKTALLRNARGAHSWTRCTSGFCGLEKKEGIPEQYKHYSCEKRLAPRLVYPLMLHRPLHPAPLSRIQRTEIHSRNVGPTGNLSIHT